MAFLEAVWVGGGGGGGGGLFPGPIKGAQVVKYTKAECNDGVGSVSAIFSPRNMGSVCRYEPPHGLKK